MTGVTLHKMNNYDPANLKKEQTLPVKYHYQPWSSWGVKGDALYANVPFGMVDQMPFRGIGHQSR
jgi:hypothetical protein